MSGPRLPESSTTRFYAKLGERIRALRVRAGLSQAALGKLLGRSASAVDRYEMGQRRVALAELVRLAAILDVSPDVLLTPGPAGRRGLPRPALPPPADLRREHMRLLAALDRRLSPADTPPHPGVEEEPRRNGEGRGGNRRVDPRPQAPALGHARRRAGDRRCAGAPPIRGVRPATRPPSSQAPPLTARPAAVSASLLGRNRAVPRAEPMVHSP